MDGIFGSQASRSSPFWLAGRRPSILPVTRLLIWSALTRDEIVFASGCRRVSDNMAIKGAAKFYEEKGKHIITCKTEHKAVLDTCRQLEREGLK